MCQYNRHKLTCGETRGFSLTEVVLALAVFSLAIVSLLGLLSVAMSSQRDSVMETTAANVASAILNQRRSSPQGDLADSVIPKLSELTGPNAEGAAPVTEYLDGSGRKVTEGDAQAQFLCEFRGWGWDDPVTPRLARLHIRLLWPIGLAKRDPERAQSYEVYTMMSE